MWSIMNTITFLFCKNRWFISSLIRIITIWDFSHVAIQIGENVYEAKAGEWVIRKPIGEWRNENFLAEKVTLQISSESYQKTEKSLIKHIGKRYDWRGALQHLLFFRLSPWRMWYWYCSEYAMLPLEVMDMGKISELISPHRLYERVKYLEIAQKKKCIY